MRVGAGDGLNRTVTELGIDVALQGPPYLVGRALALQAHLLDPPLADSSHQPLLPLPIFGAVLLLAL